MKAYKKRVELEFSQLDCNESVVRTRNGLRLGGGVIYTFRLRRQGEDLSPFPGFESCCILIGGEAPRSYSIGWF